MSLPTTTIRRVLRHTRRIEAQAFEREDGLWDIDARLTDSKTRPTPFGSGTRSAGEPIHDLWLRLTIDTEFNVVDAHAVSAAVPYPGHCDTISHAYKKLVGLNLVKGFRKAVAEMLAGTAGCTHLTDLASLLPTAAIQAFAGDVIPLREGHDDNEEQPPFQLGRCHALRIDGPAVVQYYPRWAPKAGVPSIEAAYQRLKSEEEHA